MSPLLPAVPQLLLGAEIALGEGYEVGTDLGQKLFDAGFREIHLIGHSAGAGVIQGALTEIRRLEEERGFRPVDGPIRIHATFLDGFEGFDQGGEQSYGSVPDMEDFRRFTWAENYFAVDLTDAMPPGPEGVTSGIYAHAHNVNVTGLPESGRSHWGPLEWYLETVRASAPLSEWEGYGWELSGEVGGWTPPGQPHPLGNTPVVLGGVTSPVTPPVSVNLSEAVDFDSLPVQTSRTGEVTVNGTEVGLVTGSPAWLVAAINMVRPAMFITFEVKFGGLTRQEGTLGVSWDGMLIGSIDERYVGREWQRFTFALPGIYDPGTYDLGFRLDAFTGDGSSISIRSVQLGRLRAVPEPASLALIVCALGVLFLRRRAAHGDRDLPQGPPRSAPGRPAPGAARSPRLPGRVRARHMARLHGRGVAARRG